MTPDELRTQLFATVSEVAGVFRADDRTVRRAIDAGTIPAVKVGTKTLIPVPRLLALIEPPESPAETAAPSGIDPAAVRAATEMIRAGLGALEALLEAPGIGRGITGSSGAPVVPIRPDQAAGAADGAGDRTSPTGGADAS
ncbi:helix-turn-helix domain-containing protein [Actinomadura sp. 3N407]|uniref:helix-turn-helix domain-containing protein n=1 Tax=Actinomadura sp. 3N407 TaxID=3457423 RepID=UPI003FCC2765